ncbi:MAG: SgcJ/EcaC family oxidoreductase [Anaeromyxobacteraceae bacterium]
MRKPWMAAFVVAVLANPVRADDAKVDPSITATVKKFNEAFNRFDPKEVASFWASDGTLVSPIGIWGKGRSGVEKVYAQDIDMLLKGTTSTFRVESARVLKGGYVLLDLDHEIQNARKPDGTTGTMKLHTVILARKAGKTWEFLDARPYAFLPAPPPAAK